MMLSKTVETVETLAKGAVSTAVSVAKHPIGSAAMAAGLVKGAAEAGIGLLRGDRSDSPTAAAEPASRTATPVEPVSAADAPAADPRADLPGPDLAQFEPPRPDDLPEPVVIEAGETTANDESGEPFHHEPRAASRDSEHGGPPGDREEAEGYVEEIPGDRSAE